MINNTIAAIVLFITIASNAQSDTDIIREENKDGTIVIYSAALTKDIIGYHGTTPIKLHIKNDTISKIIFPPNYESPEYFMSVAEEYTKFFVGKTVKQAATIECDAISGATFSAEAVLENIRRAAKYELEVKATYF